MRKNGLARPEEVRSQLNELVNHLLRGSDDPRVEQRMSEQAEQGESALPRRLVTVDDIAIYTGLSIHTVYAMVSQRRIPYVKVGRLTKFDVRAIDQWIAQHSVKPRVNRIAGA